MLRRTRVPPPDAPSSASIFVIYDSVADADAKFGKRKKQKVSILGRFVQILIFLGTIYLLHALGFDNPDKDMATLLLESQNYLTIVLEQGAHLIDGGTVQLDYDIHLDVDFAKGNEPDTVALGPHTAYITSVPACTDPHFWMRMEGEALVAFNLEREPGVNKWSGKFTLPKSGTYQVVTHWFGCDGTSEKKVIKLPDIKAAGTGTAVASSPSLYPNSYWMYMKEHSKYIWTDPKVPVAETTFQKLPKSTYALEGTSGPNGFYSFQDLRNAEHFCWIGSDSARLIYDAFMEVRPLITSNEKTNKFKYFKIDSFTKPDRDWDEDDKKKLRRCNGILVSLDEFAKPLSQKEYMSQIETFLGHLTKLVIDESFPIYMHTVMESPEMPTNCHSPFLTKSSDHPCNVALKDVFKNNPFPKQVRLLDNTDLTLPQLGENIKEVATVVALRDGVNIGKMSMEWRESGHQTKDAGIALVHQPNNVIVPFVSEVYTGWS